MFNYIASALMGYLLVNVLRVPGQMNAGDARLSLERPSCRSSTSSWASSASSGRTRRSTCRSSWRCWRRSASGLLIWRTRLGYEIRTVGANPTAAIYGGISPARITIITTLLSGALAGGMAVNVILGEEHRLILEFTAGFGFVGIAVALMGRAHPVGIILAAILFGMLYQGGAELAFDKPKISRDMIVVIQGLVVLFAGALEHMFRRPVATLLARPHRPAADLRASADGAGSTPFIVVFGSGIRLARAADPRLPRRPVVGALRRRRHRPRRQDAGRRLRRRRRPRPSPAAPGSASPPASLRPSSFR